MIYRILFFIAAAFVLKNALQGAVGDPVDLAALAADENIEVTALGLGYDHILHFPANPTDPTISRSQIAVDDLVIGETLNLQRTANVENAISDFLISHLEGDEGWLMQPGVSTWTTDTRRLIALIERTDDFVSLSVYELEGLRRWQMLRELAPEDLQAE